MLTAFGMVACIMFLVVAIFPPFDATSWPNRLAWLGMFFFCLMFVWGKV